MTEIKGRTRGQIGYRSPSIESFNDFDQYERDSTLYKAMKKMGFVGGLLFNYLKENIAPKLVPTPDWDSKPLDVWLKDAYEEIL